MTQEISLGCNMTYDEKGELYHPTTIYSFIKNERLEDLWMDTNLMCMGEKTSSILNEIKWKKIFLFNPGEEEFLLYKI